MRVLILNWKDTSHPAAGGAEVFTEEVAGQLALRGHMVTLFASAVPGRPSRETRSGFEVVRSGGRLGVYRAARRFWRAQPRRAFDVVVDEINTRPFMTPRWVRDAPIVTLIHQLAREIWFYETRFPVSVLGRYVLEPWWLRAYRDVPAMTVSRSSAESLVRFHGWRNITVVPEGCTPHPLPEVGKESTPTLIFVGRLVAMKRPQDALEAFVLLKSRFPSARLWVVGDGPLLAQLREAAPAGTEFLGRVPREELLLRLARAHVLIATAVREGWGLSVSEAAACGTPSIGYAVPGLVDSIEASDGALVEPTPRSLADALAAFFAGEVSLTPVPSADAWPVVAEAVETRLLEVVSAVHPTL